MVDTPTEDLRELVGRLERLAERRVAGEPRSVPARSRADRLHAHVSGHVRVRAASLYAPLLVVILGPTGAGKSTLFNTLVGRAASPTGVLRPTTRTAVVLAHPADHQALLEGTLAGFDVDRLELVVDDGVPPGLALVDAPDLDSIEHANRALADQLVEAADLCLFVTTATRYADRVPWTVLDRVRERGLPLQVVVNRMPPDPADQEDVLADVARLFGEAGLGSLGDLPGSNGAEALDTPDADDDGDPLPATDAVGELDRDGGAARGADSELHILGIPEGAADPGHETLDPATVAPIAERIAELRADREARVALAARALSGSIAGLGQLLEEVADDCEHEAIDVEALHRAAQHAFERGLIGLRDEIAQGRFLREEALRRWQDFVGADQMTRFFSRGIGRVRGALSALLRPASAPVAEVRTATTDDLLAIARMHAAEAARRTATSWADVPGVGPAIAADPDLWSTSAGFDDRLRERLDGWFDAISADIQATGRPKRMLARGASLGVNALGTAIMLSTFMHTGGLTGAEVGVAAATAFLNDKLLSALFGEAAMTELIGNARRRLDEALARTFAEEEHRFEVLLPAAGTLGDLALDLRAAARDVRALPVGLPAELRAVMAARDPVAIDIELDEAGVPSGGTRSGDLSQPT